MKEIPLTQGQVALVDDADFKRFGYLKWYALKKRTGFYAVRNKQSPERGTIYLARAIMGVTDPRVRVDHKNHDTLDNRRRKNLRICTHAQNVANRKGAQIDSKSGIRGVSWDSRRGKWIAFIKIKGKSQNLGRFDDQEDATAAYAAANHNQFGKFGGGL